MAPDITKTIQKFRKHFPSIKVYLCHDPAAWDAAKAAKARGVVRIQLNLDNTYSTYSCRIYEEEVRPASDAAVLKVLEKMYRKARRNHIRILKAQIKKTCEDVKDTKSKASNEYAKVKEMRAEIAQLKGASENCL